MSTTPATGRRRHTGGRLLGACALLGALAPASLAVAACGVPAEDVAEVIPAEELPFGLAATERPTAAGMFSLLDIIDSVETVNLYFPAGAALVAVPYQLSTPVLLIDVVTALAAEPAAAGSTYRSAIGPGDVLDVSSQAGVARVTLDERFLDLPNSEQRVAVAQLVLSLTARPGIGQIEFEVRGEPVQVPRADGTLARGPVSRDDFARLLTA